MSRPVPGGTARVGGPARDRAAGALYGLAVGDALGMPTQTLPAAVVRSRHGWLHGFEAAPPDHPVAAGLPAGSVTDDTEQAVLLAGLLLDGAGHVDPLALAAALRDWEQRVRRRGSLDLLGPSTRRALAALAAGVSPDRSGTGGTTNGAAMRVAPVGIAVAVDPGAGDAGLAALVRRVVEASTPTHATSVALAGACAVAAAVSAGVGGADVPAALRVAVRAAVLGGRHGRAVPGPDVATRIADALALVAGRDPVPAAADLLARVGTGVATVESVPAALAVAALHPDDPWDACRYAASLGGDADTVAAMAGAVVGACRGAAALPQHARRTVDDVNGLDLDGLAGRLLALRDPP